MINKEHIRKFQENICIINTMIKILIFSHQISIFEE